MKHHVPKKVIFSLFWTWVVVLVKYLPLVIFFQRNNEDVILDVLPQKSNFKIHKTLLEDAIKIKTSNLQLAAFNYTGLL